VVIDETLERRCGKRIGHKGRFYDAVRSTVQQVAVTRGDSLELPVSAGDGAVDFPAVGLALLCGAGALGEDLPETEEAASQWDAVGRLTAGASAAVVSAAADRVGGGRGVWDGGVDPGQSAREEHPGGSLAMECQFVGFRRPPAEKQTGEAIQEKGARQPSLRQRLTDPATLWQPVPLPWYGGQAKTVEVATGSCLGRTPASDPVPLRWVLVRPLAEDKHPFPPGAFFGSDLSASPRQVVSWFLGRHQIEVTFQEMCLHLGFETQRQWSVRAIARTTPCLFGLFSLVVMMAKTLHPQVLPFQQRAWYPKAGATFADALAAVRAHLWSRMNYLNSPLQADLCLIPGAWLQCLQNVACYAA